MLQSFKWDDEGLFSFRDETGHWAQIPDVLILSRDEGAVVLDLSPFSVQECEPVTVAIPEDPGRLFSQVSPGDGESTGCLILIAISGDVFAKGSAASDAVSADADAFEPRSGDWEAIPSQANLSSSHHVENAIIHGRRFARLTPSGILTKQAMAQAAAEAAQEAQRQREAEERLRQDEEREAARLAEQQRLEEEERAAKEARIQCEQDTRTAWLGSLPPNLQPDAYVVDMREFRPRIGQIKYYGVHRNEDGSHSFLYSPGMLPKIGVVTYGTKPETFSYETRQLQNNSPWDERYFSIDGGAGAANFYIPYQGEAKALGQRVERPPSLDADRYAHPVGGKVRATVDIIGNDYQYEVYNQFTIELSLIFLQQNSPPMATIRPSSNDDDWDEGEDSVAADFRARGERDVETRYSRLFENGRMIDGLDGPWDSYNWTPADMKLLSKEHDRRRKENEKWMACRDMWLRLFEIVGGEITPYSSGEGCLYGVDGIRVELTICEPDLDELAASIVAAGCQRLVWIEAADQVPEKLQRNVIDSVTLQTALDLFHSAKGKCRLFKSMTSHLMQRLLLKRDVIEGLVPAAEVGLFVGPAKLGKTSLAVNMGLCVAAGMPFGGLATSTGSVAYLFGEDGEEKNMQRLTMAGELGSRAVKNFFLFPISQK